MSNWKNRLFPIAVGLGIGVLTGILAPAEIFATLGIRASKTESSSFVLFVIFLGGWGLVGILAAFLLRPDRHLVACDRKRVLGWLGGWTVMLILAVALPGFLVSVLGLCLARYWAPAAALLALFGLLRIGSREGNKNQFYPAALGATLSVCAFLCVKIALNAGWFESELFSFSALQRSEKELMVVITAVVGLGVLPVLGGFAAGLSATRYRPLRGLLAGCASALLAPLVAEPAHGISAEFLNLSLFAWLPAAGLVGMLACLPGCFLGRGVRGISCRVVHSLDFDGFRQGRRRAGLLAALAITIAAWFVALGTENAMMDRLRDEQARPGQGRSGKNKARAGYFKWSPDGRHLAFEAETDCTASEIYTIRPSGRGLKRVTSSALSLRIEKDFVWEPDSSGLIVRTQPGGNFRKKGIYRTGRYAGRMRRLSSDDEAPQRFTLSPDGSAILYATHRHAYLLDFDGGTKRKLNTEEWKKIGQMRWCADSRRAIILASREWKRGLNIYLASRDGKDLMQLTEDGQEQEVILANPRCERLLIRRGKFDNYRLVVHEVGSGEEETVTFPFPKPVLWWSKARGFRWSRDGKRCRFLFDDSIWEMDANLKTVREVLSVHAVTGWQAGQTFVWALDEKRMGLFIHKDGLTGWVWLDEETNELVSEGKPIEWGGNIKPIPAPDGRHFVLARSDFRVPEFDIVETDSGERIQVLVADVVFGFRQTWFTTGFFLVWLLILGRREIRRLIERIPWLRKKSSA